MHTYTSIFRTGLPHGSNQCHGTRGAETGKEVSCTVTWDLDGVGRFTNAPLFQSSGSLGFARVMTESGVWTFGCLHQVGEDFGQGEFGTWGIPLLSFVIDSLLWDWINNSLSGHSTRATNAYAGLPESN